MFSQHMSPVSSLKGNQSVQEILKSSLDSEIYTWQGSVLRVITWQKVINREQAKHSFVSFFQFLPFITFSFLLLLVLLLRITAYDLVEEVVIMMKMLSQSQFSLCRITKSSKTSGGK